MLTVNHLSINFDGDNLFSDVNLKFTEGNCYGVIGANGAGKSTFLRMLSGELEPSTGTVEMGPNLRMSVLRQDHFAFDEFTVLDTIIQGNPRLYQIMQEKDALYAKDPFTEEDGNKAAELEAEFAELDGWNADTEAGRLLQGRRLQCVPQKHVTRKRMHTQSREIETFSEFLKKMRPIMSNGKMKIFSVG